MRLSQKMKRLKNFKNTVVEKKWLAKYPKPKIFNSDQGSQYTSYEHAELLKNMVFKYL